MTLDKLKQQLAIQQARYKIALGNEASKRKVSATTDRIAKDIAGLESQIRRAESRGTGRKHSSASPTVAAATDKAYAAMELRKAGRTYEEIATELNCSIAGAWKSVNRYLVERREQIAESANEVREIELQRLEAATLLAMEHIRAGDLSGIDRLLRVQERRAKLLGLDAPTVIQATINAADEAAYAAQLAQMTAEQLAAERDRLFGKN